MTVEDNQPEEAIETEVDAAEADKLLDSDTQLDQPDDDQDDKALRKVRREAQTLRERAKTAEARADELTRQLFEARVTANGKLASPADLPFDAALLDDDESLDNAIAELLEKNPHYAKRRINGDVGQGHGQTSITVPTNFSDLLRG